MGEIIIKVPGDIKEVFEIDVNKGVGELSKVREEIERIFKKIEREKMFKIEREKMFAKIVELGEEIKNKNSKKTKEELYEWFSGRCCGQVKRSLKTTGVIKPKCGGVLKGRRWIWNI